MLKTCELRSYVRARFRNIFGWSLEVEVRFSDSQAKNHVKLNVSEQSFQNLLVLLQSSISTVLGIPATNGIGNAYGRGSCRPRLRFQHGRAHRKS